MQQTVQPFKATRSIPRSVTPGGTNNGNDICSLALDAGVSNLPHVNKAEAYQDANNVFCFSKPAGNSGLPLRWQGRIPTN